MFRRATLLGDPPCLRLVRLNPFWRKPAGGTVGGSGGDGGFLFCDCPRCCWCYRNRGAFARSAREDSAPIYAGFEELEVLPATDKSLRVQVFPGHAIRDFHGRHQMTPTEKRVELASVTRGHFAGATPAFFVPGRSGRRGKVYSLA